MEPITLAAIAIGGAVLLGGKRKRGTSVHSGGRGVKGEADRVYWLNEVRGMSNWYSNRYNSMPFLDDYLTVVGFIESRFNPSAANPEIKTNPANAARGLFGVRPEYVFKSKYNLEYMSPYPNALLNPRWAFVTALHHAWWACTRVYDVGSGVVDWAAIRRWWHGPTLVHDFNFENSKSQGIIDRFENGLHGCNQEFGTNLDPDFIWQKIQGWQNYPGLPTMMKAFQLQGVYA